MTVHRSTLLTGLFIALVPLSLGCSKDKAEPAAAEPDKAVLQVARGLADGKPEVAWRSLPPSYRKDVTELVHLFANKMDADVWNQSFGVLQKVTKLARDKREYILDQPMLAQSAGDRKELEKGWDALVGILDVVVTSDLADLNKLEKLDIEAFLADTGGDLMEEFEVASSLSPDDSFAEQMGNLKRTKATVVSSSGDGAVIRVERPGAAPVQEDYVKVEGHWVPKKLADQWDAEIAKSRKKIEEISTQYMAENKASVLMQLSMVEGAVDSLLKADSPEQFNAALGPIMGMAMSAAMAQASSSPQMTFDASPQQHSGSEAEAAMQEAMQQAMDEAMQQAMQEAGMQITPSTRGERHTLVVDASTPELYEPGEISLDDAHRFVGQVVHVTTQDGVDSMCRLKDVRPDSLLFERNLYGGSVSFEVSHKEIESLRMVER